MERLNPADTGLAPDASGRERGQVPTLGGKRRVRLRKGGFDEQ